MNKLSKTTKFAAATTAIALLSLCAGQGAWAQAAQLPPPDDVTLDKLKYMSSFPPAPDQLVDQSNRTKYPQMRWVLQHTRELVPTRNIRRGSGAAVALPVAEKNLDGISFEDDKGQKISVADWLKGSYTDAIVVLHKGRIVYERYMNQMRPETPHLLFSVTKSFTGLLAAQLAQRASSSWTRPLPATSPNWPTAPGAICQCAK